MRLGVLGGTFDPVHLGHIMMAEKAKEALQLEKVLLIPAGMPMAKQRNDITPADARLNMLKLAVEGKDGLEVSGIEMERAGPSYTVETIEQLRKSGYENGDIYFIVGMDNLEMIHTWYQPEKLITLCKIAAITRPGYQKPDDRTLEKRLKGLSGNVVYIEGMETDISGTEIRKKIRERQSVEGIIPDKVIKYINENRLYRGGNE